VEASVIEDFPNSDRHPAAVVAPEILAFAAASVLHPFGWLRRPSPRTARRRDQRTVVLVPGYLSNRSSLWPLRAYLGARGVGNLLAYEYESKRGIECAAVGLRAFLKRHVRGGRIDLVGHSLGGLIARVYLQELGGARRVDRCVTLGTPHRGTYNAYWLTSRVARELRPDSQLLARLEASRARAAGVRFTSIVAGSDNIVIPRVFAAGHEDVVHVPHLGHVGLLFSPTAFRVVADRLLAPEARARLALA
jgi:triacylglycerol esterase/lipase EstA (alpha/beta hydrolase family)